MIVITYLYFFFSSSRRHTLCALVTGVQTCALPICLARLLAAGVEGFDQMLDFTVDPGDAVARRFQPALLALQLAGQFGDAAMGHVQPALRVLALLLGRQQAVAPGGDAALEFVLALLQGLRSEERRVG